MAITAVSQSRFNSAHQPSVGQALHELLVSARTLSSALWAAAFQSRSTTTVEADEASRLRAMADDAASTDPRFAQDLYILADRVERAALSEHQV
jgi:hypothetical protein